MVVTEQESVFGIDGCRGGWVVSEFCSLQFVSLRVVGQLADLDILGGSSLTLIDMPIGLPSGENKFRDCDSLARSLLASKASSVFSPPTRQALRETEHGDASDVNQKLTGKRISVQSWNLRGKILELDDGRYHKRLHESHPELCWYGLTGSVMTEPKKTADGRATRLAILTKWIPAAAELLEEYCSVYTRKVLAPDDILDSMVLGLAASLIVSGKAAHNCLPSKAQMDEKGRRMQISFAKL